MKRRWAVVFQSRGKSTSRFAPPREDRLIVQRKKRNAEQRLRGVGWRA